MSRDLIGVSYVVVSLLSATAVLGQTCAADADESATITVDEIVVSVTNALTGCPALERFVDNGDGTIRDNVMPLVWEKKTRDGGIHDVGNEWSWSTPASQVLADGTVHTLFLATLNGATQGGECFAGRCDWRLPSLAELASIQGIGRPEPSLAPAFTAPCEPACADCSCASTRAWTHEPDSEDPRRALGVAFIGGAGPLTALKTSKLPARAVYPDIRPRPLCAGDGDRSGSVTVDEVIEAVDGALRGCNDPRFFHAGDGTVYDFETGLTWEQKVGLDGIEDFDTTLSDADQTFPWAGTCAGNPSHECQRSAVESGLCTALSADVAGACGLCNAGDGECTIDGPFPGTVWSWLSALRAEGFAGYFDWRLPNDRTLSTLATLSVAAAPFTYVDFHGSGCGGDCLDAGDPQCACTGAAYWSSSEEQFIDLALGVDFVELGLVFLGDRQTLSHVRAVRGKRAP